jgi:hypothetical protein
MTKTQLDEREAAEAIEVLSKRILPIVQHLAGQHPSVQGGALANLVATWLGGYDAAHDVVRTRDLRTKLLADFLMAVDRLVPICAEELGTPHDPIDPIINEIGFKPFRRH